MYESKVPTPPQDSLPWETMPASMWRPFLCTVSGPPLSPCTQNKIIFLAFSHKHASHGPARPLRPRVQTTLSTEVPSQYATLTWVFLLVGSTFWVWGICTMLAVKTLYHLKKPKQKILIYKLLVVYQLSKSKDWKSVLSAYFMNKPN